MYVVHSGELVANQAGESGGAVRLMRFLEGDFFGETTLIEMQPRPFTVLADRDARLWELTNQNLYQFADDAEDERTQIRSDGKKLR